MTITATASLVSGVKLLRSGAGCDRSDGWIERSAGIVKAREQYPSQPYWADAFVPKLPWERPSAAELEILLGDERDAQPGRSVQLLRMPDRVLDTFEPVRRMARDCATEKDLDRLRWTPQYFRGMAEALDYSMTLLSPGATIKHPEIYFNSPGLPTVSNHAAHRDLLLGIHTDSLDNAALPDRKFSLSRVCLNVGDSDRFLLYVNLGLEDIGRLLTERGVTVSQTPDARPLEPFRRAFMSSYAEYPVIKVRLRPGEAYLAPTDNVIHDGSSVGQRAFDIVFMGHGHFQPQSD